MKISTRSLMRAFPKAKAAARKGQTVEIVDGNTGEKFLLTAKPTRTFGELAARARAIARSNSGASGALVINTEAWNTFRGRFEPLMSDDKYLDVETL